MECHIGLGFSSTFSMSLRFLAIFRRLQMFQRLLSPEGANLVSKGLPSLSTSRLNRVRSTLFLQDTSLAPDLWRFIDFSLSSLSRISFSVSATNLQQSTIFLPNSSEGWVSPSQQKLAHSLKLVSRVCWLETIWSRLSVISLMAGSQMLRIWSLTPLTSDSEAALIVRSSSLIWVCCCLHQATEYLSTTSTSTMSSLVHGRYLFSTIEAICVATVSVPSPLLVSESLFRESILSPQAPLLESSLFRQLAIASEVSRTLWNFTEFFNTSKAPISSYCVERRLLMTWRWFFSDMNNKALSLSLNLGIWETRQTNSSERWMSLWTAQVLDFSSSSVVGRMLLIRSRVSLLLMLAFSTLFKMSGTLILNFVSTISMFLTLFESRNFASLTTTDLFSIFTSDLASFAKSLSRRGLSISTLLSVMSSQTVPLILSKGMVVIMHAFKGIEGFQQGFKFLFENSRVV